MHPHLALFQHPRCVQQIEALHRCHSDHPFRKFLGVCNSTRYALDQCLTEEYWERKQANKGKVDIRIETTEK